MKDSKQLGGDRSRDNGNSGVKRAPPPGAGRSRSGCDHRAKGGGPEPLEGHMHPCLARLWDQGPEMQRHHSVVAGGSVSEGL